MHAFVLIHFATMVIFVPYDYDNRLVLPMYLPVTVIAGYAVSELLTRAVERLRGGAPARAMLPERPRSRDWQPGSCTFGLIPNGPVY